MISAVQQGMSLSSEELTWLQANALIDVGS
jgi:hypothetical protein